MESEAESINQLRSMHPPSIMVPMNDQDIESSGKARAERMQFRASAAVLNTFLVDREQAPLCRHDY